VVVADSVAGCHRKVRKGGDDGDQGCDHVVEAFRLLEDKLWRPQLVTAAQRMNVKL
jgi:hypothetical protein